MNSVNSLSSVTSRDLGSLEGPLLIFGGPYGNLPATAALRTVADQCDILPERIICTGDLVAYCAEPEATVGTLSFFACRFSSLG